MNQSLLNLYSILQIQHTMKFISFFLLLPILSSASTNQISAEPKEESAEVAITTEIDNQTKPDSIKIIQVNANVKITMTYFSPYCGGAAPSQDILDSRSQLMRNQSYNLINLANNEKTKVTTDSLGILNLELDSGNYAIQQLYKDCSFQDFMKQVNKVDGMYYHDMGEECYKNWWKSYMGEFTVTNKETIQHLNMGEGDSCFTGNNPCLSYSGPYPP